MQQLLARVGRVPPEQLASVMRPPVGARNAFRFRNKMQFTFGAASCAVDSDTSDGTGGSASGGTSDCTTDWGVLGLLQPGSHDRVLPISDCHLQVIVPILMEGALGMQACSGAARLCSMPAGACLLKHACRA